MNARENPDGTVIAPMRAEADDGTIGDGVQLYRPGDPGYDEALAEARRIAALLAMPLDP
jgi:hypothetical protein